MAELKKAHSRFSKYHTDVYALSTDHPEQALALKKEMALPFQLLCDPKRQMLTQWGLLNPFEHGGVAVPAVVIINADNIICFLSVDSPARRTPLSEIFGFLEKQHQDPSFILRMENRRDFLLPGPSVFFQMGRNFIFRGNLADWQHFFLWPLGYIKKAWAAIKK